MKPLFDSWRQLGTTLTAIAAIVSLSFPLLGQTVRKVPCKPSITFAALSDQHYGGYSVQIPPFDALTVDDWMDHPGLPEFDFVVASFGDWISDSRDSNWTNVEYCWEQITAHSADHHRLPYFFVIGNHDITNYEDPENENFPLLKERIGRRLSGLNENNYAFMYNNVLFVCVAQTNVLYHLSGFQRSWVEYLVKRYASHTTVIWSHQATYETTGKGDSRSTSWTTNDYRVHNDVDWWRSLFERNRQIKLYIHGHTEKGVDTAVQDLHGETWDDECSFVLVPSNGRTHGQDAWSYVFTITSDTIGIELWNSELHAYQADAAAGVPYVRQGSFDVKDRGMEWFSIPKRVLDGQDWTWENRMMAKEYALELVGSHVMEQIDNPGLKGCHERSEEGGSTFWGLWYGVDGDRDALNKTSGESDGYVRIKGDKTLGLATSPSNGNKYVEGKVPYNTAIAAPGKTYVFSASLMTEGGLGSADFLITIPEKYRLDRNVWKDKVIASFTVKDHLQTFSQRFTVPFDCTAWFIQPRIRLYNRDIIYNWEDWSLQMVSDLDVTCGFSVTLNGEPYATNRLLKHHHHVAFQLPPLLIDNEMDFHAAIGGSKVGMVRLIYVEPRAWSDDVSFGIRKSDQSEVEIRDLSPFNGRTTIMTFENSDFGIKSGQGFSEETFRGKSTYINPIFDSGVNGTYMLNP